VLGHFPAASHGKGTPSHGHSTPSHHRFVLYVRKRTPLKPRASTAVTARGVESPHAQRAAGTHSNNVSLVQVILEFLLAAVYLNPVTCPDCRPITPYRLGPCLFGPPSLHVWHVEHLALKSLAPLSALPLSAMMTRALRKAGERTVTRGSTGCAASHADAGGHAVHADLCRVRLRRPW
jgi:hypothetical protein